MKESKLIWDKSYFQNVLLNKAIELNNERLVEYAKEKLDNIGDKIQTFNSKNNLYRTGHLLQSLCWSVSYKGNVVGYGFYEKAPLKKGRKLWGEQATSESHLHEFYGSQIYSMFPVEGRKFAEEYIQKAASKGTRGWKVVFGILAPYWGYWEKGFTMIHGFSNNGGNSPFRGATFMKFSVMAEVYDQVRKELKPARKYYYNVSLPPNTPYEKLLEKSME